MKNWIVILSVVCLCGTTTHAEVIIDQENFGSCCVGYILDYPEDYIAQTFTVRNTGQLVGVGVRVSLSGYSNYQPVTDDVYVSLMRTDTLGVPAISQIIASRTISQFAVRDDLDSPMTDLDFSAENLQVEAGDVFAVALSSSHTYYPYRSRVYQYMWHSDLNNPHPGGEFYVYSPQIYGPTPHMMNDRYTPPLNTRDMGFRVFINVVPESTTIVMAACGLLILGSRRTCGRFFATLPTGLAP